MKKIIKKVKEVMETSGYDFELPIWGHQEVKVFHDTIEATVTVLLLKNVLLVKEYTAKIEKLKKSMDEIINLEILSKLPIFDSTVDTEELALERKNVEHDISIYKKLIKQLNALNTVKQDTTFNISQVILFTVKNGKYIQQDGTQIPTEFLLSHGHSIEDGNGIIYL